jgi:hypothetical protein
MSSGIMALQGIKMKTDSREGLSLPNLGKHVNAELVVRIGSSY